MIRVLVQHRKTELATTLLVVPLRLYVCGVSQCAVRLFHRRKISGNNMFCFSCFPVAFYLLMHSTAAQDFEITCPSTGFTVGVNASVSCKVNKTAFASACLVPATLITFHFTASGSSKNEWCTTSYTTCSNTGTPDPACGTCRCSCETDNGTFLTHRLDFIPISAHDAGNFSCEVTCFNSGNLPALTSNNCDNVSVVSPTTTSTTTATSVPPTTTAATTATSVPPTTTAATTATSEPPCNDFKCANSTICLNTRKRCDGQKDCPSGDDEQDCGTFCVLFLGWCIFIIIVCVCVGVGGCVCVYFFVLPKERKCEISNRNTKSQPDCSDAELKKIVEKAKAEVERIKSEVTGCGKLEIEVFKGPKETGSYVLIKGTNIIRINKTIKKVEELIDSLIEEFCGSVRRGNQVADNHVGTNGNK